VIATFKHKRGDGLAKCLMLAAAAEERRKWEFAAKIVARQPLPNKTIAKLQERIKELASENEAWKREAKRWRDMYIEYDEMLEKDLEKAKTRIANVTSKIKSLEKEINDEKY
jgi:predicted  nucleic acid-binding Zn-ribbon protein